MIAAALFAVALAAPDDATLPDDVAAAVRRGAELLLARQERYVADPPVGRLPDDELDAWRAGEEARLGERFADDEPGVEWPYEGVYRVAGGVIPAGYRVGGTAIACEALLATPRFDDSAERREAVRRGVTSMLDALDEDDALSAGPKVGYDVRGWAHAYALRTLLLVRDRGLVDDAIAARIDAALPDLVARLAANEIDGGGWNYANDRPSPFMTGSTLLSLYLARDRGVPVDDALVARALDALERGRAENGAFAYAGRARAPVAMPGSSARASVAELALHLAGRSSTDRLHDAVQGFFDGWDDLHARKSRQGTHEGDYAIAPYYFFYGHAYAALAIEHLEPERRDALRERLRDRVAATREDDGRWNDRIFPRTTSYGTSMAILALTAPLRGTWPRWPDADAPTPRSER